jgi:hypothetical protein
MVAGEEAELGYSTMCDDAPKLSPFDRYHLGAGLGRVVGRGTGEPRGVANWRGSGGHVGDTNRHWETR